MHVTTIGNAKESIIEQAIRLLESAVQNAQKERSDKEAFWKKSNELWAEFVKEGGKLSRIQRFLSITNSKELHIKLNLMRLNAIILNGFSIDILSQDGSVTSGDTNDLYKTLAMLDQDYSNPRFCVDIITKAAEKIASEVIEKLTPKEPADPEIGGPFLP